MDLFEAKIASIGQAFDGSPICRLTCSPQAIPQAGQAALAINETTDSPLRRTLFPLELLKDGFRCLIPPGERWLPGDQLNVLSPIGTGFQPPSGSRRWLLIAYHCEPHPLMPLIDLGGEQGAAIAYHSDRKLAGLPTDVEVLPQAELGFEWADFAAIALPTAFIAEVRANFGRFADLPIPCPTQVLFVDDLVCGFGGCLSCALPSQAGWILRCQQGPVIEWEQLRV